MFRPHEEPDHFAAALDREGLEHNREAGYYKPGFVEAQLDETMADLRRRLPDFVECERCSYTIAADDPECGHCGLDRSVPYPVDATGQPVDSIIEDIYYRRTRDKKFDPALSETAKAIGVKLTAWQQEFERQLMDTYFGGAQWTPEQLKQFGEKPTSIKFSDIVKAKSLLEKQPVVGVDPGSLEGDKTVVVRVDSCADCRSIGVVEKCDECKLDDIFNGRE